MNPKNCPPTRGQKKLSWLAPGIVERRRDERPDADLDERKVVRVGVRPHRLADHEELPLVQPRIGRRDLLHLPLGHLHEGRLVPERVEVAGVDDPDVLIPAHRRDLVPGKDRRHADLRVRLRRPRTVQVEPRSERRQPQVPRRHRHRRDPRVAGAHPGLGGLPHEHVPVGRVEGHPERDVVVAEVLRRVVPVLGGDLAVAGPDRPDDPALVVPLVDARRPVGVLFRRAEPAVPELDVVGLVVGADRIGRVRPTPLGARRDDEAEGRLDRRLSVCRPAAQRRARPRPQRPVLEPGRPHRRSAAQWPSSRRRSARARSPRRLAAPRAPRSPPCAFPARRARGAARAPEARGLPRSTCRVRPYPARLSRSAGRRRRGARPALPAG